MGGGGGGAHPLHPPPRSAPGMYEVNVFCRFNSGMNMKEKVICELEWILEIL